MEYYLLNGLVSVLYLPCFCDDLVYYDTYGDNKICTSCREGLIRVQGVRNVFLVSD